MRWKRIILLLALVPVLAGCTISRHIVDLEPTGQPRLEELEQHLNYADPDEGRPDYIIVPGR